MVKIQETPESIPEGETPHTGNQKKFVIRVNSCMRACTINICCLPAVLAYVYDEMVDICKPGDFIELTGIFRASGVRLLPRTRTLKSVYRVYIDANSIHKDQLNRYLISAAEMEGPAADGK